MKIALLILIVIISIFSFGQGRVDGFLKGQGNMDIALSGSYEGNSQFIGNGSTFNISRNIIATSAFIAYGINKKLDVNVSLPFISVNGKERGVQDGSVFLKYKFYSLNLNSSIYINFLIAGGFSSNFTDYQTGGANALGQKAKALDIRPVFQVYFPKSVFATVQTGFTYKFDPVPNAFPLAVKIGIAKSKFYADLWYDYQHSFGGIDYPTSDSFRKLGVSYHKIGGTFYKPIKSKLGVFIGASYTIAGRNTAKGFGVNAGVVLKHNKKN